MKQGKVFSILVMVLLSATILTSCGKETSKKSTEEGTKTSTSQQGMLFIQRTLNFSIGS